MVTLDGSFGEGGGQILRTALALSLVSGRAFRIEKIRAGRKKPGLANQHLAAVNAAVEIGRAEIEGAALGSQRLTFKPKTVAPGNYTYTLSTAGSTTLILQTILPALITAPEESTIIFRGGTHNPFAPPFDFLVKSFLPLLNCMGPRVKAVLTRPGFYPAGGGEIRVTIEPSEELTGLDIPERGEILEKRATAVVARLPRHIAERELNVLERTLSLKRNCLRVEEIQDSVGPGNVVMVEVESRNITEVFTAFGKRGVPAENVAKSAARATLRYLKAGVPVGEHLQDQLLLPMVLAGEGLFRTLAPTSHTTTNIKVIQKFLDVEIEVREASEAVYEVEIKKL